MKSKILGCSLWYELPLKWLSSYCGCSKVYTVQHALSYKKGAFATLRHNELCDNIAEMLQEVTNSFRIELILQPLTGEKQSIGGNVSVEAQADISARGFWWHEQTAFFDVRFFDPIVQCHENKTLKRFFELNEHEKRGLQIQDFKCWTRLAYPPCFLNNK